jgi:hypothetical protein
MMKETVDELNKKFEELSKTCLNLSKAMDSIALVKFEDTEKKRTMIEELRQMEHKISEERQIVLNAISALQKVCTHTRPDGKSAFYSSGNDSHYSYEKCDICGKEEKC